MKRCDLSRLFPILIIMSVAAGLMYQNFLDGIASVKNILPAKSVQRNLRQNDTNGETHRCRSKIESIWSNEFVDENNTDWPFNLGKTWTCPNYFYNLYPVHRRKVRVDCTSGSPRLVTTTTNSPRDIQVVAPGNKCLNAYIRSCCYDDGMLVPNVMHYVWYSNVDVNFFTIVSFISVIRFMKPCIILFHGPYVPKGTFWNFFISIYPNIIVVNQTLPMEVFGHKLKHNEHGSDIVRIKALQEFGGVYLDWDEILLKPIDSLRKHSFTASLETKEKVGNQFILSEPNATFLTHYYNGYKDYKSDWVHNSLVVPFRLAKKYPELINLLPYTAILPPNDTLTGINKYNSDWSSNYAMHVYKRGFRRADHLNMATIRYENTTLGAIIRRVLFGRKEICTKD